MSIENRLLHRPGGALAFYPSPVGQIAILALAVLMVGVTPGMLFPHGRPTTDPVDTLLALFGIFGGLYLAGLSGPQRLTIQTQDRTYRYSDYRKLPLTRFANAVSPPRIPFLLDRREGALDADAQGVALRTLKGNKPGAVYCWILLIWKDESRLPVLLAFTRKSEDAQTLLSETTELLNLPIVEKQF
ncbi:hypothetical protein CCAX7_17920 [Capsulimonas corticalis]|uniref:Uncharacterized protein n=1 Tax=Capsulimonas corticalis TaxID=2219043 RepID=A0A402D3W8_9BACT|nr:hypothetical protein [Capsulimonas corticalis]BDI29741.1 hypothetical protein CCAX7_17920 [Capsulimonas corticalis]